jgi:hypothetical protein
MDADPRVGKDRMQMKLPFLTRKERSSASSMELVLSELTTLLEQSPTKPVAIPRCLLLDTSGSMDEECEPGVPKIAALRQLVTQLPAVQTYAFASGCRRIEPSQIPDPFGSTNMAGAFDCVKSDGYASAVLITDGEPDDDAAALESARGLTLEIFYVGPPPKPAFLDELAALTGGQAHSGDLRRSGRQELETKIRGLLT